MENFTTPMLREWLVVLIKNEASSMMIGLVERELEGRV